MQFFTLRSSKIEVFETYFFDIVTTHDDHPTYVKHVLARIYMFFHPIWVLAAQGGGGVSEGIGTHHLLMQFFTLDS